MKRTQSKLLSGLALLTLAVQPALGANDSGRGVPGVPSILVVADYERGVALVPEGTEIPPSLRIQVGKASSATARTLEFKTAPDSSFREARKRVARADSARRSNSVASMASEPCNPAFNVDVVLPDGSVHSGISIVCDLDRAYHWVSAVTANAENMWDMVYLTLNNTSGEFPEFNYSEVKFDTNPLKGPGPYYWPVILASGGTNGLPSPYPSATISSAASVTTTTFSPWGWWFSSTESYSSTLSLSYP